MARRSLKGPWQRPSCPNEGGQRKAQAFRVVHSRRPRPRRFCVLVGRQRFRTSVVEFMSPSHCHVDRTAVRGKMQNSIEFPLSDGETYLSEQKRTHGNSRLPPDAVGGIDVEVIPKLPQCRRKRWLQRLNGGFDFATKNSTPLLHFRRIFRGIARLQFANSFERVLHDDTLPYRCCRTTANVTPDHGPR